MKVKHEEQIIVSVFVYSLDKSSILGNFLFGV